MIIASLSLCFLTITTVVQGLASPWPRPQKYYIDKDHIYHISAHFQFLVVGKDCLALQSALSRYEKILSHTRGLPGDHIKHKPFVVSFAEDHEITAVKVNLTRACDGWPGLNMTERYDLTITADSHLTSSSIWGILRGLETFSQLVYHCSHDQLCVQASEIHDYPRFKHRGIMLDTARHFLSKNTILRVLEAMSFNKLNVFHWHITDDQSFPYQSQVFPELSEQGAYDSTTHIYSPKDVEDILEFARLRGIRVVPEFDSPGHTLSWGKGHPRLLTPCYMSKNQKTAGFGPLNPASNYTYEFLTKLMQEVSTVFKDHYVHLGGDQISYSCWQSNPDIKEFMENMSFGDDFRKLASHYMGRLLDTVSSCGSGSVVWQDVFDNNANLKPETIVQIWQPGSYKIKLAEVTEAGHPAILSAPWYLNKVGYPSEWTSYYAVDPLDYPASAEARKLVIGGEACLWGEWVDDTNIHQRLWPRASAVAERLWSALAPLDKDTKTRMDQHRCRMVGRGVPAEPANGPGYCPHVYHDRPPLF